MDNQIFAYVDGIPTKGLWIDMDVIDSCDEIKDALVEGGFCTANYDGDILVAAAEGLCEPFLSRHDCFAIAEFVDCRDHKTYAPDEAKIAYVNWMGSWSGDHFDDAYYGDFYGESDPKLAFTENYVDEAGLLSEVPENLRYYFDYEAFARDLFINDFHEEDGYIFRNC